MNATDNPASKCDYGQSMHQFLRLSALALGLKDQAEQIAVSAKVEPLPVSPVLHAEWPMGGGSLSLLGASSPLDDADPWRLVA